MELIYQALTPLASLKVQERFIVNGTMDEYLLPEELLNDAINVLFEQKRISFKETEALNELKEAIKACDIPEGISAPELIGIYEPWKLVREKSKIYLKELGFDLAAWEKHEL